MPDVSVVLCIPYVRSDRGGSKGGVPFFFGGPPNFIKRGKKTSRACSRIHPVLVVNSYRPPPTLSEILYLPLVCTGGFRRRRDEGRWCAPLPFFA